MPLRINTRKAPVNCGAGLAFAKVAASRCDLRQQTPELLYGAGSTTVLPSMLTAVCASSLPLIDAPVRSVIAV